MPNNSHHEDDIDTAAESIQSEGFDISCRKVSSNFSTCSSISHDFSSNMIDGSFRSTSRHQIDGSHRSNNGENKYTESYQHWTRQFRVELTSDLRVSLIQRSDADDDSSCVSDAEICSVVDELDNEDENDFTSTDGTVWDIDECSTPLSDLKEESISLVSHGAKHCRSTSAIACAIALGVEVDSELSEKSDHSYHPTLYEILSVDKLELKSEDSSHYEVASVETLELKRTRDSQCVDDLGEPSESSFKDSSESSYDDSSHYDVASRDSFDFKIGDSQFVHELGDSSECSWDRSSADILSSVEARDDDKVGHVEADITVRKTNRTLVHDSQERNDELPHVDHKVSESSSEKCALCDKSENGQWKDEKTVSTYDMESLMESFSSLPTTERGSFYSFKAPEDNQVCDVQILHMPYKKAGSSSCAA